jgi:hypothetical protein
MKTSNNDTSKIRNSWRNVNREMHVIHVTERTNRNELRALPGSSTASLFKIDYAILPTKTHGAIACRDLLLARPTFMPQAVSR